jgi:hypothetical protein
MTALLAVLLHAAQCTAQARTACSCTCRVTSSRQRCGHVSPSACPALGRLGQLSVEHKARRPAAAAAAAALRAVPESGSDSESEPESASEPESEPASDPGSDPDTPVPARSLLPGINPCATPSTLRPCAPFAADI